MAEWIIYNQSEDQFEINIEGPIGSFENDKQAFLAQLRQAGSKPIKLNISSLGGNVDDALRFFDALKQHEAKVTAELSGFVASAATIIALAADEVIMNENAFFLIHKSMAIIDIMGGFNEDDIDLLINQLEEIKDTNVKVDAQIASIYVGKTRKGSSTIAKLMQKAEWLNAEEAKKLGFIDKIKQTNNVKKAQLLAIAASLTADGLPSLRKDQIQNLTNMENVENTNVENNEIVETTQAVETKEPNLLERVKNYFSKEKEVKLSNEVEEVIKNEVESMKADFEKTISEKDADLTAKTDRIAELEAKLSEFKTDSPNQEVVAEEVAPEASADPVVTNDENAEDDIFGNLAKFMNQKHS